MTPHPLFSADRKSFFQYQTCNGSLEVNLFQFLFMEENEVTESAGCADWCTVLYEPPTIMSHLWFQSSQRYIWLKSPQIFLIILGFGYTKSTFSD